MAHKTKTADLNPEENLVATTKSTSVSSRRQSPRLVRKAATAAEDKTKKQTPSPLASTSRQTDKANEISSSISSSRRGRKSASVVAEDDSKADHRGADPKNHLKKTGSKVPKAKEDPPAKPESVAAAAEEEEDAEKETTGAGGGDVDDTSASRKRNLEEEEEEEEGKTEKADAKQEKRPKQDPQPKITKRKIGPDHGDGGGGDDEVDANTDAKKAKSADPSSPAAAAAAEEGKDAHRFPEEWMTDDEASDDDAEEGLEAKSSPLRLPKISDLASPVISPKEASESRAGDATEESVRSLDDFDGFQRDKAKMARRAEEFLEAFDSD